MKLRDSVVIAFFAARASTQSLGQLFALNPSLSVLGKYIASQDELRTALNTDNITVFAPRDAVLGNALPPMYDGTQPVPNAALLNAIIKYHIVPGVHGTRNVTENAMFIPTILDNDSFENVTGGQVIQTLKANDTEIIYSGMANKAQVIMPDLSFDKGIVHIVDAVFTLPQDVPTSATAANLTSFMALLQASNLTSRVDETPDITVFAPENQAFERVGSVFTNASSSDLSHIAQYHIAEGATYSANMTNKTLMTLDGKEVHLSLIDGTAYVNSARVLSTDLLVNNGVLHILENVLNPQNTTGEPEPRADPQPTAFASATSAINPIVIGVPPPSSAITLAPSSSIQGQATGPTTISMPTATGLTTATTTSMPTTTTSMPTTTTSTPTTTTTQAAGSAPIETGAPGMAAIVAIGAALFNM
ncbi:hypothetical protein AJ79_07227 [Helicocarpus griseus UAMH5409]|uniref:FAS1 domain-containing protein n=1 Tax=Helicocarpus griseus UAMH5409 TaxID=1447875 RepID=A0A2B7WX95_9EURO|nr:hypothetical protein AJ79_07227 [Helicocarpus griseus UAMH5409]